MSSLLRALVLVPLALLPALSCGSAGERQAADVAGMTAMLEEFLPVLGRVYADGDVEALRPWAAEKELARIAALVASLADQGRYLAPELRQLTVEDARIWNNSNAFVTTLEVWDVRMHALGSGELLAEDLGKRYRVKYQLKRDGGSWRVLFRAIQD